MDLNQKFFEKFWPKVAVAVTSHRPQTNEDILPLLRRLRIRPGARVLDVPCGFGRHSVLLAKLDYRVTGVDIGREVLAEAARRAEDA
ncbi:MAG: methyltransferase domain-containing protein, partial [Acidobacteria bacterium]|nr:methyltransferase domain-containing protein [Acidobacteriota bacterium]